MRRRVPTRHSYGMNAVFARSPKFCKKTLPARGIFGARSTLGAVARRLGGDARGSSDGSEGACGGDGGSSARIVRGRNEYHRNALRGVAKSGAFWSSGSTRANRTVSGAPELTLDTLRASAGAAESALSEEPRAPPDCDPRAGAGGRWRDSFFPQKRRVELTWPSRGTVVFERLEYSQNGREIVRPGMILSGFKTRGFSSLASAFRLSQLTHG